MSHKFTIKSILLLLALLMLSCGQKNQPKYYELSGPYLGQKPPGDVPELFAPEIVSTKYNEHSGAVFTSDGKELFWSREINLGKDPRIIVIMHMKLEDDKWTQPELASFNFKNALYNHINSISPDGNQLYFYTYDEANGSRVWVVNKTQNGWGEPHLIRLISEDIPGSSVNEVHETRNGNIYCTGPLESMPRGRGIVRSKFKNGKYQEYESLGPNINFQFDDPYPNHSPTVDPDERFVIFVSRRPGGFGTQDLYVSYRQPDHTWGEALNLGPKINTIGTGNSWPQLSPDGKFLFFISYTQPYSEKDILNNIYSYEELTDIDESILNGLGNIYWVDTKVFDQLKPQYP